uniref:RNA-directed DNA polymerase n=1 Tax=Anopheles epiroticus TaxID=199890 RepID=A0A182PWJ4_9DIPT
MIVDEHPIPRVETIFNLMKGATLFCHLDITDAYAHLTIDEEFRKILTLNTTTHGLIRPTRAVYGAANIPAIWQRRMETVLRGLTNVQSVLKLNRSKYVFAVPSLECLGHRIDKELLHKSTKHIEAISNAPRPSTPEELQLFLGKATYYSAFIPNLSSRTKLLRDMLKTSNFECSVQADEAYRDAQQTLISPQVLMQYDPSLPLLLATDASKTGLGAVLSHRLSNGTKRPIAYASCSLSKTEQRYPIIDKDALAIVWATKKFFHYLYARKFTLITDHKPLTQIFSPEKSLPTLCISRMANYADYLSHFNFTIEYKTTSQNANADYCSRIPSISTLSDVNSLSLHKGGNPEEDEFENFVLHQIQQLPVRAEHIAQETRKDLHLGKIIQELEMGRNLENAGYKAPEAKYTLVANCLLFEHRVVIPTILRPAILNDLHVAHIGMVKMKSLARSYVYWLGIDVDIEQTAKSCPECARQAAAPPKFSSHHWDKWVEVKVTQTTRASAIIDILDGLFATFGTPVTVVSDNGTQFTSTEFKSFLQRSGVKVHKLTAPYHSSTNGQAERYVQTIKRSLKAMNTTSANLQSNLNQFLQQYRKAHRNRGVSSKTVPGSKYMNTT